MKNRFGAFNSLSKKHSISRLLCLFFRQFGFLGSSDGEKKSNKKISFLCSSRRWSNCQRLFSFPLFCSNCLCYFLKNYLIDFVVLCDFGLEKKPRWNLSLPPELVRVFYQKPICLFVFSSIFCLKEKIFVLPLCLFFDNKLSRFPPAWNSPFGAS